MNEEISVNGGSLTIIQKITSADQDGATVPEISDKTGVPEESVVAILNGQPIVRRGMKETGFWFIRKPDESLRTVFKGDRAAYERCVWMNFWPEKLFNAEVT